MDKRKLLLVLLLFVVCFVIHKLTEPRQVKSGASGAVDPASDQIDYSIIVPPEQLTQFKDKVIYRQPEPEKDPLWMNPPDTDLMPPKDPNDPHTGVM